MRSRPRVLGRLLKGEGIQEIQVVQPVETISDPSKWAEVIEVDRYALGKHIARSPFGVMVYPSDRAEEVADALITLGSAIRRNGRA